MQLALFDLDNTLLIGDSDVLWTEFLIEQKVLSEADRELSDQFYEDYKQGRLDLDAFVKFQLAPLTRYGQLQLEQWRDAFLVTKVRPSIAPRARSLLAHHRDMGHTLLIVTATNRFTTEAIAAELEVDALLATELERHDGQFTGRIVHPPCFREGKIEHLQRWLTTVGQPPRESWFYSDSVNDVPLLEWVDHPIVVDPDQQLRRHAESNGWPIITLR